MNNSEAFQIRPANREDITAIRQLILEARINLMGLDWRRFWVAVDEADTVIGCGQIKPHRDGSQEVASIVVKELWRQKGVASAIIRSLIRDETEELWLMCRSELVPFYERFGFVEIKKPLDMPPYFRRIKRLWLVVVRITAGRRSLSVMMLASHAK
jgi:N-acetylglutamate synthase-like GNAT family acetyltransferase